MLHGLPEAIAHKHIENLGNYEKSGREFPITLAWREAGIDDFVGDPYDIALGVTYVDQLRERRLPGVIATLEKILEERA